MFFLLCARRLGRLRPRQVGQPGPDRRQRAHEAAGAQQAAARTSTRAEIAVQVFLVHLIHVQQPVGGAAGESEVLYVFADHAGALFVAAPEEVAALMQVLRWLLLGIVVVLFWHWLAP